MSQKKQALNVLGGPLEACSRSPMTGWMRNGCCETDESDHGRHVICARMTDEFLAFSSAKGNDLSTPVPAVGFPGLKAGDCWCLCAERWREALLAGKAPRVLLRATEASALEVVSLDELTTHAIDLN